MLDFSTPNKLNSSPNQRSKYGYKAQYKPHITWASNHSVHVHTHMYMQYKDSRYRATVTNNILMSINYHFSPYKNLDSRTHPKYHKWTAIQGIFGVSPIIIMPTVDDLHNWYMSQGVNLLSIQCCNIWPQQQTQRLPITYILTYTITFAFRKIQVQVQLHTDLRFIEFLLQ